MCVYTKITHTQTFGHVSANIFTRANILTHAGGHIEAAAANAGGRSRRRLSVGYVCVKFHRFVTVRLMRFCKVNNKSAYGNGFLRTCCPRNSRKVSEKFTQALQDSHYQAFAEFLFFRCLAYVFSDFS